MAISAFERSATATDDQHRLQHCSQIVAPASARANPWCAKSRRSMAMALILGGDRCRAIQSTSKMPTLRRHRPLETRLTSKRPAHLTGEYREPESF
jgi:hypothetical protein